MRGTTDLIKKFSEYLDQLPVSKSTRVAYLRYARSFETWIREAGCPEALTDVAMRKRVLPDYWDHLSSTHSESSVHVARSALAQLFGWIELPPGSSPSLSPPSNVLPVTREHYLHGTWIDNLGGSPRKARLMCRDGRLRTTEWLSAHHPAVAISVIQNKRRYKISGTLILETPNGQPGPDLVAKFKASGTGTNIEILGAGLWYPDKKG